MKKILCAIIASFLVIVTLLSTSCGGGVVKKIPDLRDKEDAKRIGEIMAKYITDDMLVYELRLKNSSARRTFQYTVDEATVIYSDKSNKEQTKAFDVNLINKKSVPNTSVVADRYSNYHGVNFTKFDYIKISNSIDVALDSLKGVNIKGIDSPLTVSFDNDAWARAMTKDGVAPERIEFDENDLSVGEIRFGIEEEVSMKKVLKKNEHTLNVHNYYMNMDSKVKMKKINRKMKKLD